jgi:hypothetical protein
LFPALSPTRQHPAARHGSQSAYKAKTATTGCLRRILLPGALAVAKRPFSKQAGAFGRSSGVAAARRARTLFNSAAKAAGVVLIPAQRARVFFFSAHLHSTAEWGKPGA